MRSPAPRTIFSLQAGYYLPTAVLPFLGRRRFEALTGPKLECWLVLTVSALVGVIGSALALAARRETVGPEIVLVGAGSAAALGTIDIVYVARRRISPVYLLDAALQVSLLAGWLASSRIRRSAASPA